MAPKGGQNSKKTKLRALRGFRLRGGRQSAAGRSRAASRWHYLLETQPRRVGHGPGAAAAPPARRLGRLAGCRRRRRRTWPTSPSSRMSCNFIRYGSATDDVAQYYEGFSNATLWPLYHDVIVKPIYHREWWDRYVDVNRRFAEATSRAAAHGAHGVGPGLPAAAGPEDAAHVAARPDHRFLSAHPVPAGGAVHADAVAHRDHRRPARRRPGRLPSGRRCAEFPVPVPAAGRRQHLAGSGRCAVAVR